MSALFPATQAYARHHLSVTALHTLYLEESGNPDGLPVIFLHGGPGAGCDPSYRRFFDPAVYRVILFDQRGCGRSTPHAELRDNTTQALLADIEAIREHLRIEQWVVSGGSWGTTLGLAYAQQHTERVLGMILRGVFLCRQRDLDWLYGAGTRYFFPQDWENFIHFLPPELRDNPIAGYYQLLTSGDAETQLAAARAWATWEGRPATLLPNENLIRHLTEKRLALSLSRISTHYFVHHCFLRENQLLMDMHKIQPLPGIIVHGRYDMLCPLENAWTLHQLWPQAELNIVADAGHSAGEAGISAALVDAGQRLQEWLTSCRLG